MIIINMILYKLNDFMRKFNAFLIKKNKSNIKEKNKIYYIKKIIRIIILNKY